MVKNYRKESGEFISEFIVIDSEKDNIVTIHLHGELENHIATIDWYYIDHRTGTGKNSLEEFLDLNKFIEVFEFENVSNVYTKITKELENGSCLVVSKVIKNNNDTYTL